MCVVELFLGWSAFFKLPDKFFGNFADEDKQMFPGKFLISECIADFFNKHLLKKRSHIALIMSNLLMKIEC